MPVTFHSPLTWATHHAYRYAPCQRLRPAFAWSPCLEQRKSNCPAREFQTEFVGLARTVYTHRIWPYVWWFPRQKNRIYTVYTYKCMILANPKSWAFQESNLGGRGVFLASPFVGVHTWGRTHHWKVNALTRWLANGMIDLHYVPQHGGLHRSNFDLWQSKSQFFLANSSCITWLEHISWIYA